MISKFYRGAFILAALGTFVGVPMLNAHPSPMGNVREAIEHAKEAQGKLDFSYETIAA